MFTAEQREQVRQRILEVAQSDPRIIAGALTGSRALGGGDRWSDIDVAFGIAEGITPEGVLEDWTAVLAREWDILDYFDLPFGSSISRVFLARPVVCRSTWQRHRQKTSALAAPTSGPSSAPPSRCHPRPSRARPPSSG